MNQKTNDQMILERIIEEDYQELEGAMSVYDYFELYSATEVLKDYDLSYDEILSGIVGNGLDGGIDSIYLFLNGELIKEDTELSGRPKRGLHIELKVIQSKTSAKFKEDAIIKFRESAQDLFNLSNDLTDFRGRYNSSLIAAVERFRDVYSSLARYFPSLAVNYYYVTQGAEVHPNVSGKVLKLKEDISQMFSGVSVNFDFIGASELLELRRKVPSTSRNLEIQESFSTEGGSYACLVTLPKYAAFVSDDGSLARSIFESNVRDYQGNVNVNTNIRMTLQNLQSENFWYLNNGVTIITPKAVLSGRTLTIEDPQIVNGLQTSHEIYNHFSSDQGGDDDARTVLVRVICEEDEDARDRIIRATNSQTTIPAASLRSSDEIHRDIEDYLKVNGYFYDRKKNFYKNQGKPASKIISIQYLAQVFMSICLLQPNNARARPSTLINNEADYKRIYSRDTPIEVYYRLVDMMKQVEGYLKPEVCGIQLERKAITNIKFYVAMVVGFAVTENSKDLINQLVKASDVQLSQSVLSSALEFVCTEYDKLGATDQVAKGTDLVAALCEKADMMRNIEVT